MFMHEIYLDRINKKTFSNMLPNFRDKLCFATIGNFVFLSFQWTTFGWQFFPPLPLVCPTQMCNPESEGRESLIVSKESLIEMAPIFFIIFCN